MIKIENGYCEIRGSLNDIKEDFRLFLKAIVYYDTELLPCLTDVIKEELKSSAKNNSDN